MIDALTPKRKTLESITEILKKTFLIIAHILFYSEKPLAIFGFSKALALTSPIIKRVMYTHLNI